LTIGNKLVALLLDSSKQGRALPSGSLLLGIVGIITVYIITTEEIHFCATPLQCPTKAAPEQSVSWLLALFVYIA